VADQRTLLDHGGCTRHKHYRLSCDQFDALHEESGGRCQICHRLPEDTSHRMLCIDHDGLLWAVRGLLCGTCNSTLGKLNDRWDRGRDYVARPWWLRQCEKAGLPPTLAPEPDLGSSIRNQFGIVWMRRDSDLGVWWEMPTQYGQHRTPMSWEGLWRTYGSHNLAPFDLVSLFAEADSLSEDLRSVRHQIETGPYWAATRKALNL
jgi:hypothetical protein